MKSGLGFELAYRTFYERNLARASQALFSAIDADSTFGRYYAKTLSPLVTEAAQLETSREANIDFTETQSHNGQWKIQNTPTGIVVLQNDPKGRARLMLTKKRYDKPFIVTFRFKVLKVDPSSKEVNIGFLFHNRAGRSLFYENHYSTFIIDADNAQKAESDRKALHSMINDSIYYRYALHATPLPDGRWVFRTWPFNTLQRERDPITWGPEKFFEIVSGPASVGFLTGGCAVEFSDISLEFISPSENR